MGPTLSEYAEIEIGLYPKFSQNHISMPAPFFRNSPNLKDFHLVLPFPIKREAPVHGRVRQCQSIPSHLITPICVQYCAKYFSPNHRGEITEKCFAAGKVCPTGGESPAGTPITNSPTPLLNLYKWIKQVPCRESIPTARMQAAATSSFHSSKHPITIHIQVHSHKT